MFGWTSVSKASDVVQVGGGAIGGVWFLQEWILNDQLSNAASAYFIIGILYMVTKWHFGPWRSEVRKDQVKIAKGINISHWILIAGLAATLVLMCGVNFAAKRLPALFEREVAAITIGSGQAKFSILEATISGSMGPKAEGGVVGRIEKGGAARLVALAPAIGHVASNGMDQAAAFFWGLFYLLMALFVGLLILDKIAPKLTALLS